MRVITPQPHDRHADRVPANVRHADAGKVFPLNVPGTVQVGVDLMAARATPKDGLRQPVTAMHMPPLTATLAGMPGIDGLHDRADSLRLVGDKA
jgi:hypothetical protein